MSLKTIDEHSSIVGYTKEVYQKFGVNSPDDLDQSRRVVLNLIDHDGKIIDLGSGNGWFLKYLVERSLHNLTPYGVDISEEAINEAKTEVFPDHAKNFKVADIEKYKLTTGFDYIIVNPLYTGRDFIEHFEKYYANLNVGGKLILMITNDTLERMEDWCEVWDFLRYKNLKWVQMNPLSYGVAVKHDVIEEKGLESNIKVRDLLNLGG
jgi:16S rRNA G1207 methylase RsmC